MERKKLGTLAEAKILAELVRVDIEPYLPFAENGPVDILGIKDQEVLRISVKGTSNEVRPGVWRVELRTVSRRNLSRIAIKKFNNTSCDILAVYIEPQDKVVFLDSKKITATTAIEFSVDDLRIWISE